MRILYMIHSLENFNLLLLTGTVGFEMNFKFYLLNHC
jgi:hypothetical protein